MRRHVRAFAVVVVGCLAVSVRGAGLDTERARTAIEAFRASWVRVEIELRYDKGEGPDISGWGERCPNCGEFHLIARGEELLREERPLESGGLVLSEREVLTSDFMIHPRFVEKIAVRFGDKAVGARVKAYAVDRPLALLELEGTLGGVRPVKFASGAKGPFLAVDYNNLNGEWQLTAAAAGLETMAERDGGLRFQATKARGLAVAADGRAVGVFAGERLPLGDSWQGSPLEWEWVSAADYAALIEKTRRIAEACLVRVRLNLRSPRAGAQDRYLYRRYLYDDEEEGSATEKNVVGVVVAPTQVLILANLDAKTTARLEKITVYDAQGKAHAAVFAGTLSDYGALVARMETPMEPCAVLSTADVRSYVNVLLPAAQVMVQGSNRTAYYQHKRIAQCQVGWRRQIYPQVPVMESKDLFLFDRQGRLVAIPVARREKVTEEDRWYEREKLLTSTAYLARVFGDLQAHIDTGNVPLSEEQENRLAWLGVELQGLNRELARINNVSDLTRDGETGAMVSYVYPGSPAARMGIEAGAILLRVHVEGVAKPLEVKVDEDDLFMADFPWEDLDEVPAEYLDQIPTPWPGAENAFARALTDAGFGKSCTIEFVAGGEKVVKPFVIEEGPRHYDSAKRYKAEALGLTVRDLTYEVRRFLQRGPDEPGVIVSKVEPGSKAAVAGIKTYEVVTRINDQDVKTVDDFEKLIAGQEELRIALKRMMQGRVVNIKMAGSN